MTLKEYKQLVNIRFPYINTEQKQDGWKRTRIDLLEKVALEIFKEGRKISNSKLNIITREKLIEYDKTGMVAL